MDIVIASFASNPSKRYAYFVPFGDEPAIDDLVITSVGWDAGAYDPSDGNLSTALVQSGNIARVVSIEPTEEEAKRAARYYVALVPIVGIRERHAANKRRKELECQRREARTKLDRMLAERERMPEYEKLAQDNPEAAALLQLLKEGEE